VDISSYLSGQLQRAARVLAGRHAPIVFSNMIWVADQRKFSRTAKPSMTLLPTLSVRIDLDTEARIGPGKIQLLENIQARGSISAAGRTMNMSYMRAWVLVNEINRICGRDAVERKKGGRSGGGAILTPFGLSLVARYRKSSTP
jgi:molybdate transport system regulatory protein